MAEYLSKNHETSNSSDIAHRAQNRHPRNTTSRSAHNTASSSLQRNSSITSGHSRYADSANAQSNAQCHRKSEKMNRSRSATSRAQQVQRQQFMLLGLLLSLILIVILCFLFLPRRIQNKTALVTVTNTAIHHSADTQSSGTSISEAVAYADRLAAGYDYDGAISYLQNLGDDSSDAQVQSAIAGYEATKATCVAVDVTTVPHIFYHSLVNDPSIAFNASILGQAAADGMNAWMTTVDEFDKITQQLYDNGYVYVRLRDLVKETTDADGTVHFTPRTDLMLPEGKKAIVLSVDDLSYYHSYSAASFPDHLVLDDNGKVKCHYVQSDGTESIGDYDVVPRLNSFLEEHPDGAYQGARGLIALTGYNGVFGYRTDIDYEVKANLMSDQAAWLEEHPDYNRDEEIAQAKVIANALKEEGWEFASHTWGHLSVTNRTAEQLANDNQKWIDNVANIVGQVDTIIFAHGNDIGDWMPYSSDNDKYQMYYKAGYRFYCNVDSSVTAWVQINDDCVRQGRINMDGYTLYRASLGETTVLDSLVNASEIFDSRRPTPVVANGQG